jgi:hypothetical protein
LRFAEYAILMGIVVPRHEFYQAEQVVVPAKAGIHFPETRAAEAWARFRRDDKFV